MTRFKDTVLLSLLGLLLASLLAFVLGIIPYPFGLFILTIFIAARIIYLKGAGR
jgi:ABC-type multidrug transport system permease subunit